MLYLFGKTLHHSQIIFRLLQFASNGSLYIQPFGFETLTGTNTPPVCSITSPSNNASFTEPANITISASATDADGSISKVEFYRGTTKLGEDHTSPYSQTWSGVAAGSYSLKTKAYDNEGAVTTSSAINVSVYGEGGLPVTLSKRIATGIDDVEENKNGGIYTNSSDIELDQDGSTKGNQTIGLRFTGLTIPQSSTITKAYIQFTCDEKKTGEAENNEIFANWSWTKAIIF